MNRHRRTDQGQRRSAVSKKVRPTLHAVARAAGVSYMTVFRTFNSPDMVKDKTKEKVTRAASDLGYIPNLLASQLKRSRSWSVAMVVPALSNSLWSSIAEGAHDVLAENGHHLFFGLVTQTPDRRALEEEQLKALLGRWPEGMILVPFGHTEATRLQIASAHVPVVEVVNLPDNPLDSAVGFSLGNAFFELGRALVKRGYKRFGFLKCDLGDDELLAPRLERLRSAVSTFGKGLPEVVVQNCKEPTIQSAKSGFGELIKREPGLDIVVCANDYFAYGALTYCRQNGISVPKDVAIAGFGDMEFSADFSPSLTTISVDGRKIGRRAAEHLLRRIDDGAQGGYIDDVGYRIVFRESA